MLRGSRRFLFQVGLTVLSGFLFFMTLAWRDWIEIVFQIDPDRGSGSLEWAITALTAVGALTCGVLARAEWKRVHVSTDSASSM